MLTVTLLRAEYAFYQGLDSDGGDIINLGGRSIDQLKTYCDSNPTCLGFNTNGWIKNVLKDSSKWNRWSSESAQGFYLKLADFAFAQGLDSSGGDIQNLPGKSVLQLKVYCSNNPSCLGFNTNGWVKSTLKPQSQWSYWTGNSDQGFYYKKAASTTAAPVLFTFYPGFDSNGGDIKNIGGQTVDQLKAYCISEPTCLGFNTNGWVKNTIRPQNQWYQWTNSPSQGFYLKQAQYVFYQGLDSNGGDIKNIAGQTVDQLKAYCSSEPTCLGFNTNGWVKNVLRPLSSWSRWSNASNEGFYAKVGATTNGAKLLISKQSLSKNNRKAMNA